jgi:tryptophan synthase alpha chain
MTYINPVFVYGIDKFMARCKATGVDGVIIPDVPFEEKGFIQEACREHGIIYISMVAPSSAERIAMIAKEAEGFLYVVSSLGVTGVRSDITTDIGSILAEIRKISDIPCAIGFGISNAQQAKAMSEVGDGVIIGSAIINIMEKYGKDSPKPVGAFVAEMVGAIRSGN